MTDDRSEIQVKPGGLPKMNWWYYHELKIN